MYDLPAVRAATDEWWAGLARHFRAAGLAGAPDHLERDPAPDWTDPELLFSQTCGYPLTHALAGRVQLLCTPCYAAPGCDGPRYRSVLVVAADSDTRSLADLRGARCAINASDSHSGCNVLHRMVAPLAGGGSFFAAVTETGSHAVSLDAVTREHADLCAVDVVIHALLARHAPECLAGTRVLAHSPPTPGLPYIAGADVTTAQLEEMHAAIRRALADPALAPAREALLIEDVETLTLDDYQVIPEMEREAVAMGYSELR